MYKYRAELKCMENAYEDHVRKAAREICAEGKRCGVFAEPRGKAMDALTEAIDVAVDQFLALDSERLFVIAGSRSRYEDEGLRLEGDFQSVLWRQAAVVYALDLRAEVEEVFDDYVDEEDETEG